MKDLKNETHDLLTRLLEGNMLSHKGDELVQEFISTKLFEQSATPEVSEEWINCQTEMPKYNERVLLCSSGDGVFIGELKEKPMHNEDGWEIEGDEAGGITVLDYITNWQPLPNGTLF